jgi:hypothetical protein
MIEEEIDEKETTLMEDKRDYLKYPLNSYIEHNANLNAFDDEDALILYIIDKELEKQR